MSRVDFAKNLEDNGRAALIAECQDCGHKCPASELGDIADFEERVAPGEECPAGECPKCGALAHIVEPPAEADGGAHTCFECGAKS